MGKKTQEIFNLLDKRVVFLGVGRSSERELAPSFSARARAQLFFTCRLLCFYFYFLMHILQI